MNKHGVWLKADPVELIADLAIQRRYSHIWVFTDPGQSMTSHGEWSVQESKRHDKLATVSVWKRGAGKVNIIYLNNTAWVERSGAFKGILPAQMLDTVYTIENELGITIGGSPGGAGWELLKKIHPEWIESVSVNLRDIHFIPKSGPDLIWQEKNIAALAQNFKYVHKLDKGAAYPAASTMTDTGVGTPVHMEDKEAWLAAQHEKGHPQDVGVWNCHVTSMAIPDFTPFNPIPSGDYWLAGPRIRMLEAAGYSVEPFEGWVFPERHDVLVKWANVLWNKRQEAKNPIVKSAYKQIANTTIGFTAFHGFEDEDEKRRPDIRLQVVSRNAEIMFHNIEKVRKLQHETPCMVYMDAAYYFSNAENGRAAYPVLVEREGKLGGFKYEGRVEITPDVTKMFTRKMSVADRLEVLNVIGWTQ